MFGQKPAGAPAGLKYVVKGVDGRFDMVYYKLINGRFGNAYGRFGRFDDRRVNIG